MHGFILLLSSIAHWKKNQSIFDEAPTRLENIEKIFAEVTTQTPDWNKIGRLLEGFPSPGEYVESLIQDGEMLKQQPNRWERERREVMVLLVFMKCVFNFVRKHPRLRLEFNLRMSESTDESLASTNNPKI